MAYSQWLVSFAPQGNWKWLNTIIWIEIRTVSVFSGHFIFAKSHEKPHKFLIGSDHHYSRDVFFNITQHWKKKTCEIIGKTCHIFLEWLSWRSYKPNFMDLWALLKKIWLKMFALLTRRNSDIHFFSQIHAKFVLKIKDIFIFNFYHLLGHIVGLEKTQLHRMLLHW